MRETGSMQSSPGEVEACDSASGSQAVEGG